MTTTVYPKNTNGVKGVTTNIESEVGSKNDVTVTIHPAKGDFTGFVKEKVTEFRINVTSLPKKVTAPSGKEKSETDKGRFER